MIYIFIYSLTLVCTGLAAELQLPGKIFVDRPESYSATNSKNCTYIYCAEKVALGLDLISPYFYSVRERTVSVFSLFRNYLSLEKNVALYLNKLESTLPKDVLCQVWLRLAHARELRPVSRINVNKFTINLKIFCRLCIHEKKKKREKNVQSV